MWSKARRHWKFETQGGKEAISENVQRHVPATRQRKAKGVGLGRMTMVDWGKKNN